MKAQRLFAGFICSLMFSISTLLAQINVESHWPGGRCQAIALNDEYALATFGSFLYVLRLEDYQEIATLQLPDVVSDITIEASTAYMAARAAGIFVVDLSNPQQPAMVARVGDYTRGVHVDGQHLYGIAYTQGVRVYDISTPAQPMLLGSLDINPIVQDLTVNGDYIYCAGYSAGVAVINQSDPSALHELPGVAGSNSLYHITCSGNRLYASTGPKGSIDIFDISNPAAPELINTFSSDRSIYQMTISGTQMIIDTYSYGLHFLDLTDPDNPVFVEEHQIGTTKGFALSNSHLIAIDEWDGLLLYQFKGGILSPAPAHYELDFASMEMWAVGTTLYIPENDKGMRLIDVSNPAHPIEQENFDVFPSDMLIHKDIAYMVRSNDLYAVDVNDANHPVEITKIELQNYADNLYANSTLLFAWDYLGARTCCIVNISEPRAPTFAGLIEHTHSLQRCAMTQNFLFMLDDVGKIYRADLSDPLHPQLEANPVFADSFSGCWIQDTVGYFTASTGEDDFTLKIYDLSDPLNPVERNELPHSLLSSKPLFYGTYAIGGGFLGQTIFDFSDPYEPLASGFIDISGYTASPVLVGNYLVVLKVIMEQKLSFFNLQNPHKPTQAGVFAPMGKNYAIAANAAAAFVANDLGGLYVLDRQSNELTNLTLAGQIEDVALQGNYAYLAVESEGMRIIDISDGARPQVIGQYKPATNGSVADVAVEGHVACLLGGAYGIKIIDVSEPQHPFELAALPGSWGIQEGGFYKDYLYVCDGSNGIKIIDVKDPANPGSTVVYDTPGYAFDICFNGNYAFLADGQSSLRILDISNPIQPTEINSAEITYATVRAIDFYDHFLIVAAEYSGLYVFDVADPQQITQMGRFYVSENDIIDVSVHEGTLFACDENYGVYTLTADFFTGVDGNANFVNTRTQLLQNFPNPFASQTMIPYILSKSEQVKIDIYNLRGQYIRTLVHTMLEAGSQLTFWDGLDSKGRAVASGLYMCQMKVGNEILKRKMMLVR